MTLTRITLTLILAVAVLAGCARVGEPSPTPEAATVLDGPAIRAGVESPAEAREAFRLVSEGEGALERGDFAMALARATEVITRLPEAVGSAQALWLAARSAQAMGDGPEAEEFALRYVEIPGVAPEAATDALLLIARVRTAEGRPGGVEVLFRIPTDLDPLHRPPVERAISALASALTLPELRDLVDEAPSHPFVLPPFLAEFATRRLRVGDTAGAMALARLALDLEPSVDLTVTLNLLAAGEGVPSEGRVGALGALLSTSGSPAFQGLTREIREGIEVALSREEAHGLPPTRLEVEDDGGDAGQAAAALRRLEGAGVFGVVGPLMDPLVRSAVDARIGRLPLISPTARVVPTEAGSVLALTGGDPEAARTLAALARREGVRRVVVMYPDLPEMSQEAGWFRDAFEGAGGTILRSFAFPPRATNFADPMQETVRLAPDGLVLLLPPELVELVAPQVAFHGVDDLEGLKIFGNETWSSDAILQGVNPRHTEGVFTVTSREGGTGFGPGWSEFVSAYEEHFQRTLRSPVPALGYDAALLLLRAARDGGGTPEGTARALESIRDFPGATGRLSIVDGRIRRTYLPVRIEGRRPVLLP